MSLQQNPPRKFALENEKAQPGIATINYPLTPFATLSDFATLPTLT